MGGGGEKERKRGRERNIDMIEKHQLVAFCTCPKGLNKQPRYMFFFVVFFINFF